MALVLHPNGHRGHTCTHAVDLAAWRRFCEWLEEQPYNATYWPKNTGGVTDRSRLAADERRLTNLIYWANGFGWRLHKNWQARLAELEAQESQP